MTIYFLQEKDNPEGNIKIGIARPNRLYARFKEIERQSPVELAVLGTMPGMKSEEKEIHTNPDFERAKSGEWFRPTLKLLNFIKDNATPQRFVKKKSVKVILNPKDVSLCRAFLPDSNSRCKAKLKPDNLVGLCGVHSATVNRLKRVRMVLDTI